MNRSRLEVGEFPATGSTAGGAQGSVAFHITPADAIRASGLYYFLRGDITQNGSVVYNGEEFKPGSLHADADFSRLSLAYEHTFLQSTTDRLVGSLGLTYMYLNPTLRPITEGHGVPWSLRQRRSQRPQRR